MKHLQPIDEAAAAGRVDAIDALAPLALLDQEAGVRAGLDLMGDGGAGELEPLGELADVQALRVRAAS